MSLNILHFFSVLDVFYYCYSPSFWYFSSPASFACNFARSLTVTIFKSSTSAYFSFQFIAYFSTVKKRGFISPFCLFVYVSACVRSRVHFNCWSMWSIFTTFDTNFVPLEGNQLHTRSINVTKYVVIIIACSHGIFGDYLDFRISRYIVYYFNLT